MTTDESQGGRGFYTLPLADLVARQAEELFRRKHLPCGSAVLFAINQRLGGGLDPAQAARLAAGLSQGMGGAGGPCGALMGANLAVGLFLGSDQGRSQSRARRSARRLHEAFTGCFGETACPRLCGQNNGKEQEQCASLTGQAARLAAQEILAQRPGLARRASGRGAAPAGKPSLWRRLLAAVLS